MTGHFERLLQVLSSRSGGVMLMVEGYFDESGDLDDSPGVFCVSGYFIETEAAKAMDAEWLAVLEKYQLSFFHMVDCAHGNAEFQHLSKVERDQVVRDLIGLIKKYTLEGFSILAKSDSYKSHLEAPDVYSDCASGCVRAVQSFLKMNRVEGSVAYFFESGHKNSSTAYSYVGPLLKRDVDSVVFAPKQQVRLLQAADLLAWQSTKYAKDYFYARIRGEEPKRAPRKDFLSLMEHSHIFAYMGANGEKESMGAEIWPMSKRAQYTTSLSMEKKIELVHWLEAGDATPIIPVEATVGWRPGGAKFAYVAFNGFEDKRFALGFDEPRLFEAVTMFLEATGAYENSKNVPLFSADDVKIDNVNGLSVLRIKLRKGATIAFHLPPEVLAQLSAHLKK
jgi:hypothetical protein